jgi:hypothetical protein
LLTFIEFALLAGAVGSGIDTNVCFIGLSACHITAMAHQPAHSAEQNG